MLFVVCLAQIFQDFKKPAKIQSQSEKYPLVRHCQIIDICLWLSTPGQHPAEAAAADSPSLAQVKKINYSKISFTFCAMQSFTTA